MFIEANWNLIIFFVILFCSLLLSYFYRKASVKNKNRWYWHYPERFCYYSGLTSIFRKFFPAKEDKHLPTGWVWLIGIYFAAYAFTSQRYESKLDKIEFRYNTFTTQVAAGATFHNKRLMKILNSETPVKPHILDPFSIFKSFYMKSTPESEKGYSEKFYQSYNYASAVNFRQEIIDQWNTKLDGADFGKAELEGADFRSAELEGANFVGAKLEGAYFGRAKLEGAYFVGAELEGADFRSAELEGADFWKATSLTAKQLIRAENIYGIRNCPPKTLKDIKELDCKEMLKKRPDDWSDEFKKHRKKLIEQWEKEEKEKSKE